MLRSRELRQTLTFAVALAAPFAAFAQASKAPAPAAQAATTQRAPAAPMPLAASYDPALYSALRYRMIGPLRGGRVTAVTGVPSAPLTPTGLRR